MRVWMDFLAVGRGQEQNPIMFGLVFTNKSQLSTACPASHSQDPTFERLVGLGYTQAMSAPLVVEYFFVSGQSDFEIISQLILGGQTSRGLSVLTTYFQYIFNTFSILKAFPLKASPSVKCPRASLANVKEN